MEDLLSVLPFGGRFDLVRVKGSTLKEAFEHSVRRYGKGSGELLQVGGTFSSFLFSVFQTLLLALFVLCLSKNGNKGDSPVPHVCQLTAYPACLMESLQHVGHHCSRQQRQDSWLVQ